MLSELTPFSPAMKMTNSFVGATNFIIEELNMSDDILSEAWVAVSKKQKNDSVNFDEGWECSDHNIMEVLLNNIGKIILLLFLCPLQVEISSPYSYYL